MVVLSPGVDDLADDEAVVSMTMWSGHIVVLVAAMLKDPGWGYVPESYRPLLAGIGAAPITSQEEPSSAMALPEQAFCPL
jgi:hypothetical protein